MISSKKKLSMFPWTMVYVMIIVWADCSEATHMLISHPISSQTELRSLLFAHPSIAVSQPDCLSGLNGGLEGFRAWADVKMETWSVWT